MDCVVKIYHEVKNHQILTFFQKDVSFHCKIEFGQQKIQNTNSAAPSWGYQHPPRPPPLKLFQVFKLTGPILNRITVRQPRNPSNMPSRIQKANMATKWSIWSYQLFSMAQNQKFFFLPYGLHIWQIKTKTILMVLGDFNWALGAFKLVLGPKRAILGQISFKIKAR